ncbi:MAG: hypothetical protein R3E83_25945 [Burkholderiaceae bacterium]
MSHEKPAVRRPEERAGPRPAACGLIVACLLMPGLAGCVASPPLPLATAEPVAEVIHSAERAGVDALARCQERFETLDQALTQAGLRDAQAERVPGFSYLRVSRLLRSYRDDAAMPAAAAAWLARMRQLDQQARKYEIANLGTHRAAPLLGYAANTPLSFLLTYLDDCGRMLIARDRGDPGRIRSLRAAIESLPVVATLDDSLRPIADLPLRPGRRAGRGPDHAARARAQESVTRSGGGRARSGDRSGRGSESPPRHLVIASAHR